MPGMFLMPVRRAVRLAWRCSLALSLWLLVGAPAWGVPVVQVLHNGFVSAEKFQRLQAYAEREGMQLRHLDVERASPDAWRQALRQAPLLVLDVPRPNDRAMVEQALRQGAAQQGLSVPPRLTVGGGRPAWQGLAPAHGAALAALYAAGGHGNFGRFFALAKAVQAGQAPAAGLLAPPERLPATGFYHPDAPRVLEDLPSYLAWHADRRSAGDAPGPAQAGGGQAGSGQAAEAAQPAGRVAFLIHQGVVADMLTREVDALIARSEAAGLLPAVFWFDAAAPGGLAQVLGKGRIDVLVNLTHMQDGAARSRDFLALDVPVIQTLRFREGEAADWPQAPSGVSARTAAVFLAGPEGWGISDPLVLSAATAGVSDLLPAQLDALMDKLQSLVALRRTAPADKKLALMFWNYPAGEKNLGASNLNIPRSIVSIQAALAAAGYAVGEPLDEAQVIAAGQRMLGALYGSVPLDALLAEGLAALYPLADYERWLAGLPAQRQAELRHGGAPARHRAVREIDGRRYFVVPRWQLGHLLVMPQMPRHADPHGHYHDTASAPDHLYMAAYLYLRQQHGAHALVHLGTHGTQEWLPGKDRGLAASDYPWLAVGSLPVFYPYIQDNVGEAIQARRRGRAVTLSHQTPPFAPAGLYDQLRDLHHLIHEYEQLDEGGVRERVAAQIRAAAVAAHLHDDLGWTAQQAEGDFPGFLQALHDQLHELARTAMPLGLHTYGQPASAEHRASTVMQQLGEPLQAALGLDEEAMLVPDPDALPRNPAYRAVRWLLDAGAGASDGDGDGDAQPLPAQVQALAGRARALDQHLRDTQENEALLAALAGRFVAPGPGGDPIRNPDVPSGRNLYAFEADKIPARAAYEAAQAAYAQLVQAFRAEHDGAWPRKLAFSLWASEAIRHLGVTEAQILHALGLRPVWDAGGRVSALEIIPAAELGRPRSDVVVQVTGVYRDQFDSFMRLLDEAMRRLAELDEPGNPIAANNRRIAAALRDGGLPAEQAEAAARSRIFGNAPGEYGTGVPDLARRSTEWEDDAALARQFLSSSRHAYGSDGWGQSPAQANLLAEQLRGAQAAVMSRSSNLHGVLSTDHPFEFLGGLSAAIRHLDGKAPQLLISDLRGGPPRTTGLARFLADELRVRYLNPQWIAAMQQEGYAGTLQVLNATNNLFGWQAVDADTVRADQWQAMFDTYVADTRGLGTGEWFERHNPTAQAQVIERMAEAIRKGYWDAPEQTRQALARRWQELAGQHGVDTGAPATRRAIAQMAPGYGLQAVEPPAEAAAAAASATTEAGTATETEADAEANAGAQAPQDVAAAADQPLQDVQGQVLARVQQDAAPHDSRQAWVLAFMLMLVAAGGLWQAAGPGRAGRCGATIPSSRSMP
ncbi:cobaltochelatase subunit CobN [Orrella sp. JC864]|uniref:cobaltochelatase subunit CobN n=1 Tax=Orrella sp. JC864 TaxID=3120298 RepID=UPI003008C8CF